MTMKKAFDAVCKIVKWTARTMCSLLMAVVIGIPACVSLVLLLFVIALKGLKKDDIKRMIDDVFSKY